MGDPGGPAGFTFIARPYVEVVSFTPIGAPVPNRGGAAGELFITGLIYDLRITDLVANEPLHLETGMWLNLAAVQGGTPPDQPIVRSASIPHGDSVLALGTSSEIAGPPDIQLTSAVPDAGPEGPLGYADAWQVEIASPCDANVDANANATRFACDYWIETIEGTAKNDGRSPDQVQQLQYSQQTNIEFLPQFGNPDQLIMWPHVNVNTLRKQ